MREEREEREEFDKLKSGSDITASKFMYDDLDEKKSFNQKEARGSIGNMGLQSIDMDMIIDMINEQEEEKHDEMIANNLV